MQFVMRDVVYPVQLLHEDPLEVVVDRRPHDPSRPMNTIDLYLIERSCAFSRRADMVVASRAPLNAPCRQRYAYATQQGDYREDFSRVWQTRRRLLSDAAADSVAYTVAKMVFNIRRALFAR